MSECLNKKALVNIHRGATIEELAEGDNEEMYGCKQEDEHRKRDTIGRDSKGGRYHLDVDVSRNTQDACVRRAQHAGSQHA